jgi:hypothetical protein
MVSTSVCPAIGIKNLRIEDLVKASDVIVIADVVEVTATGPAPAITFRDKELPAEAYTAELAVRASIKGSISGRLTVNYRLPTLFIGYQGLRRGMRLVFLRKEGTGYGLANPYYPDLPAISVPLESKAASDDYSTIVLHEMLAVIASSSATPAEKSEILRVDYTLPSNSESIAAFKSALGTVVDPDLKQRLQGELIRLGDISEVPDVAHTLLSNLATENQRVWLLYVIGNDLANSRAIPALQPLLRANDDSIREAATEALWHIADFAAVPSLAKALEDPDAQVRFYAVRGCADIAKETGWGGPGESEFHEHQQEYLTHWKDWAKSQQHELQHGAP